MGLYFWKEIYVLRLFVWVLMVIYSFYCVKEFFRVNIAFILIFRDICWSDLILEFLLVFLKFFGLFDDERFFL